MDKLPTLAHSIKKEYEKKTLTSTVTEKSPDGKITSKEVTRDVKVLTGSTQKALQEAQAHAKELQYNSVTLLSEDHDFWYFEFYNPVIEEVESKPEVKKEA